MPSVQLYNNNNYFSRYISKDFFLNIKSITEVHEKSELFKIFMYLTNKIGV